MAPIIGVVLTEILFSCSSSSGMVPQHVPKERENPAFSLDSDSSEGEELAGIDVDINFLDEKASAVHALGNIALNCASIILDRLPEVLQVLNEISFYFHENIRYHVCLTYTQIAVGLARHFAGSHDKFIWKKGLPVANPLHS